MKPFRFLFAIVLLAMMGASHAAVPAFSARYQVIKNGSPVGEATMTLRQDADAWVFTTRTRGTSGLAGLLGLDIDESSRFRWRDDRPELLDYDYHLDAGLKTRKRSMRVDWVHGKVNVNDNGTHYSYASTPGLVERHLLALALSGVPENDPASIRLPVAVKREVQTQTYRRVGSDSLSLPIGTLTARRITRTDDGKDFTAWFESRYAVPVKLEHGAYILLLENYSTP